MIIHQIVEECGELISIEKNQTQFDTRIKMEWNQDERWLWQKTQIISSAESSRAQSHIIIFPTKGPLSRIRSRLEF